MADKGKRMIFEDEYQYLKDLKENHEDPTAEWGGGSDYTAGEGIDITEGVISIDDETVALKTDIPDTTDMVTTDTDQEITGVKAFKGDKKILFKQNATGDKIGFTGYDYRDKVYGQLGYLEMQDGDNPSNILGVYNPYFVETLPYYGKDFSLGFKYNKGIGSDGNNHNFGLMVPPLYSETSGSYRYIPIDFKNGSTTVRSDNTGVVDLSSLMPSVTDVAANTGSTPTATLTDLQVGSTVYEVPAGGGSSYTFTNGLTESNGTVSWDLNDKFNYSVSGRSIVSSDAQNFNANNLVQNSTAYMPLNPLSYISNKRYNNMFVGFGNRLSTHDAGFPQNNTFNGIMLIGDGLRADYDSNNVSQIILGFNNVPDATKAFIIGNGTNSSNQHNLMTIDRDGNLECNNIPAAPTTQGTYTLQVTVDQDGNPTYSWV